MNERSISANKLQSSIKVEVMSGGQTYVSFGGALCEAHANMTKTLTKHGVMKIDSMTTYTQSEGGYFPSKRFIGEEFNGLRECGDGI